MRACMNNFQHGYYSKQDVIVAAGERQEDWDAQCVLWELQEGAVTEAQRALVLNALRAASD